MSIPTVTQDGVVHIDLSEDVAATTKARQITAARVYMDTLTAYRACGATYNEASGLARKAFWEAWEGKESRVTES